MKLIRPITPGRAHPEVRRLFPRNYAAHIIEGGLFMGGVQFIAAETVAPVMVETLGGPSWLVALTPMMMFLGAVMLPLFTAHFFERMNFLMPYLRVNAMIQRMPYLLGAVALYFFYEDYPMPALFFAAVMPFLSGLIGGSASGAWLEMYARTVPPQRRSSSFSIRNILASVIGLGAGTVVAVVLTNFPGHEGYAILYFIAWVFLMSSGIVFCFLKEPDIPRPPKPERPTFGKTLRLLPVAWKSNQRFRYFLLARAFGAGFFIVLPFIPIHAKNTTGLGESFIGQLVVAQMIGGLLGNIAAAYVGDKYGSRVILITARLLFLLGSVLALWVESALGFYVVYVALGLALQLNMAGQMTLTIEVAPNDNRPSYVALITTLSAPFMLSAWGISSTLRGFSDSLLLPALACIIGMSISLFFLMKMTDPRADAIAESEGKA